MSHRNAPLTPEGRRRLCQRVDSGRPICHVAAEAGIARQTLAKWHARWREGGIAALHDRSSRPASSPGQTDPQIEDLVEYLRRSMKLGPVMLTAELADFGITMHASTVHRILVRRGVSRLADLDVTGADLRQQPTNRYEHPLAGDLVHLDVKKVGRIPDGGGWRTHGRGSVGHKKSQRVRRTVDDSCVAQIRRGHHPGRPAHLQRLPAVAVPGGRCRAEPGDVTFFLRAARMSQRNVSFRQGELATIDSDGSR